MSDKEKIRILQKCFEETIWMSIRYAHGRHTYAPSIVRDAIRDYKGLFPDFKLKPDVTVKKPDASILKAGFVLEGDYLNDLFDE
jgi:hypothetical protein